MVEKYLPLHVLIQLYNNIDTIAYFHYLEDSIQMVAHYVKERENTQIRLHKKIKKIPHADCNYYIIDQPVHQVKSGLKYSYTYLTPTRTAPSNILTILRL